ncbi:MAG: hypothetical protein MRK01_13720 [Candidatus Scalindua sp.]|nr:hypothetical protein [Candidatus Scalindua sp.]
MLERKIKHKTAEVKKELSELVEKGYFVEYEEENAHVCYRINRNKYEEIKAISDKQKQNDKGKP